MTRLDYVQKVYGYIDDEWSVMLFEVYNYTQDVDFESRQDEEALELQSEVETMIYKCFEENLNIPNAAGIVVNHLVSTNKIQLNTFDI